MNSIQPWISYLVSTSTPCKHRTVGIHCDTSVESVDCRHHTVTTARPPSHQCTHCQHRTVINANSQHSAHCHHCQQSAPHCHHCRLSEPLHHICLPSPLIWRSPYTSQCFGQLAFEHPHQRSIHQGNPQPLICRQLHPHVPCNCFLQLKHP